jgi:hypothetical protein
MNKLKRKFMTNYQTLTYEQKVKLIRSSYDLDFTPSIIIPNVVMRNQQGVRFITIFTNRIEQSINNKEDYYFIGVSFHRGDNYLFYKGGPIPGKIPYEVMKQIYGKHIDQLKDKNKHPFYHIDKYFYKEPEIDLGTSTDDKIAKKYKKAVVKEYEVLEDYIIEDSEIGTEVENKSYSNEKFTNDPNLDPSTSRLYQTFTKREYACILLGVPESGTAWLDKLILKSNKQTHSLITH